MDTITIEMLEQYGLKYRELSKELAQKVSSFQNETLEWQGKYDGIKKELKDFIFKEKKEAASVASEKGMDGKVIQLESKAAATNEKSAAPGDSKMINMQSDVISPVLARTVMREFYKSTELSWNQLTTDIEELKEKVDSAANPQKDMHGDMMKIFKTIHAFKLKADQSSAGKKQYENFLKGMPVPIKIISEQTYTLLKSTYNVMEEDHARQKSGANYIAALQTLYHSSFTLMHGLLAHAGKSFAEQNEADLKDVADTVYQVSTFRNIMLDLLNRKQQVFLLYEQLAIVSGFNNLQLQAMLTLSNGLTMER